MKVVQLHNRYRKYGGEDAVLNQECALLRERGHLVGQVSVSNETLEVDSIAASVRAGVNTVWSRRSYKGLENVLTQEEPDILHVHNTFPQLSPSIYWAASKLGIPVVQTLHNYRIACTNGLLMREGGACEDCVGRAPLPALKHRCYRGSLPATAAVASMLTVHRALGTYQDKVEAYIALTNFAKSIMVRSGLPEERVYVKPNFVTDGLRTLNPVPERVNQLVFLGRLSHEKGWDLLLDAWRRIDASDARLVVVGDGPERPDLERKLHSLSGVVWRGWLERKDALREVARSRYLVVPSRAYEGFPMVLAEAFSVGTPVIAPNHAGYPEIVNPEGNGMMFFPGSVESLARSLDRALQLDEAVWRRWSTDARHAYLVRYTPEGNYDQLMEIYEEAIERERRCARS